jgi:putative amide transporter protein
MPYVCLLLSGAALLVKGLATVGHVPRRDAGVLNLVVGVVQLVLGVAVLCLGGPANTALTAAGIFLFGLTYVYAGLDALMNLGSKGLGWFCGMVAFVAVLLAAVWLAADPLLAALWLAWAVLWGLMFGSLALGQGRLDRFIGWAVVLASQVTATVPAVLGLAGAWPRGPEIAGLAALVIAALFGTALVLARRMAGSNGASEGSAPTITPSSHR